MTNLLKIPTWADEENVHAIVETPRGSTCKLDFDPKLRVFTLAKPLMAGLTYPYDWGFIPSTKAQDGDPLDVLVIHDAQTYPGVVLRCRPVGILEVEQTSPSVGRFTQQYNRPALYRETPRRDILTVSDPHGSSLEERN